MLRFARPLSRVFRAHPIAMSCCQQPSRCASSVSASDQAMHDVVENYYGKVLSSSKDLKTDACTTAAAPHPIIRNALKRVPNEIISRYYGCGTPIPFGIKDLHVLDLGCGTGRDCYVAADMVGENGSVTGIDMTDEQLEIAHKYVDEYTETLGYPKSNLKFLKGYIEFLREAGIKDSSLDMVISNCVVNLSPDKKSVIKGVHDALKSGGEFYFSDVYSDRRLPEHVAKHDVLVGECLGGALYIEDFKRICHQVGFTEPRELERSPIAVQDPELLELVGNAKFYSITYRLFKLDNLETLCEDYGQVAKYKGTIPGHSHKYDLDDHHCFVTGKPMLVCGNTASMVGETWLGQHFEVTGDHSVHFGLFDCGPDAPPAAAAAEETSSGGGCC